MNKPILIAGIIVILVILAYGGFYTVDEAEQAVVLQFQKIITEVTEPGLHFKIPFIQDVEKFEKRILDYDSEPKEIITQDKKTLVVDNFAKWQIVDMKTFYETVRNESMAQLRLDDIIYSDLRNELGKYTFSEIVTQKRKEIMDIVTNLTQEKCNQYGIKVLDVRLKRVDLPQQNEAPVFDRMRAERLRQANLYRSEGEEEALKIRADTDKQRTIIMAEAYQQAETAKGEGDARALTIYANGYNRDPDFFQFMRTLEAYQ
ncbi:MAG: protease modulator HflC, partial [bacterium]|nr:protease modulator HflC [bacterium]